MNFGEFLARAQDRGDKLRISALGGIPYLRLEDGFFLFPALSMEDPIENDLVYYYCEMRGLDPGDFGLEPADG